MSVDLMGSTAFKAIDKYANVVSGNPAPEWVSAFRTFYQEFPPILKAAFLEAPPGEAEINESAEASHPRVWKTVGDEIVFCNRVTSIDHTAECVTAFVKALDRYSSILERATHPLKVKGAGWLAAFPAPNISIEVFRNGNAPGVSASDGGQSVESNSWADIELRADREPHSFDFLGKGIDTGFRIAKNAADDRFVVSAELAYVLSRAASKKRFSHPLNYHGRESLKGVVGGTPYPVISVDTERNELQSKLKSREAALTGSKPVSSFALCDFLETFMQSAQIENPYLSFREDALDPDRVPRTYQDYRRAFLEGIEADNKKYADLIASPTTEQNEEVENLEALEDSKQFLERFSVDGADPSIDKAPLDSTVPPNVADVEPK